MIEDPEHLTWALGVRTRGGGRIRLSTGGKKVKALSLYNLGVLDTVGLPTTVLMRIL